jgi:eukaryotic-like serine/threonine-protein kinase
MELPATVGKYELLEFLGGGMSHVYRARDTVIDRPVVVKLLSVDACHDEEAKARFLQEARLAGNIQHENIVSVFDFGEHEGRPFIVMEYLKGEDLREAIHGQRTGNLLERMKIALEIATALEYVNGRGIVHRDIKPENIHIDSNGRVRLMDFGIAKTADLSLTKTGVSMGTPYYMAPEQVEGKPVSASMDIYSFGMLFYELLTGLRAVNGDSMPVVMYQILSVPLDAEPMVNAGVPPRTRALVLRCVEKRVEDRPESFSVVVEELRGLISGVSDKTQPVDNTMPISVPAVARGVAAPRRSIMIWLAPVVFVVMAAGVAWWGTRGKPRLDVPAPKGPMLPVPAIAGMTYIPSGRFLSGPRNTPMSLPAFYIDSMEVSNAEFAEYCHAKGTVPPEGAPNLPVVHVTAADARGYATWRKKRLPSALEWERAARGIEGARFPWGDAEDKSLANVEDTTLKPVESYADYRGIYQMAGNVWEMVDDGIAPSAQAVASFSRLLTPPPTVNEKWITIRGGSFHTPLAAAVGYEWSPIPERYSSTDIGFRCAKSAP